MSTIDVRGEQVNRGLELIGAAQSGLDAVTRPLGAAIAADPEDLPQWLRPWQAAQRRMCDRFAVIGDIAPGSPFGRALNNACAPYLGNDAPDYSAGTLPFTGGQCPELYNLSFSVTVTNPNTGITGTFTLTGQGLGPFNGIVISGQANTFLLTIDWTGADQSTNVNSSTTPSIGNIQLVRQDGQPDNCGNPPPTGTPGYLPTRPGPAPPPNFPYNPGDGGPSIEINVGNPTLNIDGTINLTLNVGGTEANAFGGYPEGTSGDDPADGPDLENPGTPETPEPGENEKDSNTPLVCAVVRTTVIDPGRGFLVLGDTERRYDPPLAYLRFKFNNGSTSAWVEITHPDQLVCYSCCDVEADGYYVKWSYQCNGSVTPIRLKSQRED